MKTFFERLKEERIRLDLNQSEFAAIGGVQKGAQINYEQGKRNPDSEYLAAIASAGADVQYILTGIRAASQVAQPLSQRESALLDNYQHTDDYGKGIIEATAFAAAESKQKLKRG